MATGITHFTSQRAAAAILDRWRKDLIRNDQLKGDRRKEDPLKDEEIEGRDVWVRLYSRGE